jgi:DNA-binding transcriptional LysR family regulator
VLEERRLQIIAAVVEDGGVRAAAERLNLDPSVVSRHISEAEKRLGLSLFDRVGKQIKPTETGAMIANFARERAVLSDELMGRINALKDLRAGQVSIATGEGFLLDLLQNPLARFCANHPDIGLLLEVMTVDTMIAELEQSRFEIGIAHNPDPHPALRRVLSRRLPIDLIVPAGHPLAKSTQSISIDEIAQQRLALLKDGFGLRKAVEVVEYVERIKFQPRLVTNSLVGLKGFVLSGMGVTMMPSIVMREDIRRGRAVAIPIDHEVMKQAEMHLLVRKGRRLSPAASKMLIELTRYLPAI